jgi:alpha-ketoglutarate-dependent taurine dioxygenase
MSIFKFVGDEALQQSILYPETEFGLIVQLREQKPSNQWLAKNKSNLLQAIKKHSVVVLKKFDFQLSDFKKCMEDLFGNENLANNYTGGSVPRSKVDERIFNSTEAPESATLVQHHELSYMPDFPKHVAFYCETPSQGGGCTPIGCIRSVSRSLDPSILKRFEKAGVIYVRKYISDPTGQSEWCWQRYFETKNKAELEAKVKKMDLKLEWTPNDGVALRNLSRGTLRHPETDEVLLFNQAIGFTFYSEKKGVQNPIVRHYFKYVLPKSEFDYYMENSDRPELHPYTALWGDTQEPIELSVQEQIQEAYSKYQFIFKWEKGDIMLIDNINATHGRDPFTGNRKILAAMSY